MKRILLAIALGLVILISVVLIKTVRFTSRQLRVDPVSQVAMNEAQIAEHLAKAIQFRTISNQDPKQFDKKEFLGFSQYLEQVFPKIHSVLKKEVVGDYSLLYTWEGQPGGVKPILFMGHMDVVPIEPGTEKHWTHPPFAGRIAGGYVWGRGTIDNKVSVIGILEAIEVLLTQGFHPSRTIYLAFGHDEEVGGLVGAANIARLLYSRGVELEYILDEGGAVTYGIVPRVSAPVALIGIAEKGYLSIKLTVHSQGGHSSMPPQQTAIGILSTAIQNLERNQFPAEITGATGKLFEYLGPEMPLTERMVFANLWLFGWLVERQLVASSLTNALVRTTTAATMFESGVKENVLPTKAKAVINFRILPGESVQSVIDHVRKTIGDARVKITPVKKVLSEPSAVSVPESSSFENLHRTIRQIFPDAIVAPWLVVGATDSRHYAKLSGNIYRFVPIRMDPGDTRRFHGTDERISVDNYENCVRFFMQLIRNSHS